VQAFAGHGVQDLLARQAGEGPVDHRHVWLLGTDRRKRLPAVARLADQLQLRPLPDRADYRVSVEGLAVRSQDAHSPSWHCTKSLTGKDS
jgi:hypothetical protein